jgi:hypothetical protein
MLMSVAPPVGRIILPAISQFTTFANSPDLLFALPVARFMRPVFVDAIGCRVNTIGVGPNLNARMGIYRSRNGLPGELLFDSGLVSVGSTGGRSVVMDGVLPWSLSDHALWTCLVAQNGNSTNTTFCVSQTTGTGNTVISLGVSDFGNIPFTTGSLPSSLVANHIATDPLPAEGSALNWSVFLNTGAPIVGLRRAL